VFPEEVEEAIKTHEAVRDAVCVGVPDERFGQAITGVVELLSGASAEESEVISVVKSQLAAYKAPKRVLFRESLGRAANGKADYNGLRQWATRELGLS
ncbi:MAG: acyl-CoA synthetase, partial [Acidobacteriota bacterium]